MKLDEDDKYVMSKSSIQNFIKKFKSKVDVIKI